MSRYLVIDIDPQWAVRGRGHGPRPGSGQLVEHATAWVPGERHGPPPLTAETAKAIGEELRERLKAARSPDRPERHGRERPRQGDPQGTADSPGPARRRAGRGPVPGDEGGGREPRRHRPRLHARRRRPRPDRGPAGVGVGRPQRGVRRGPVDVRGGRWTETGCHYCPGQFARPPPPTPRRSPPGSSRARSRRPTRPRS